jgi:hypothetical protein
MTEITTQMTGMMMQLIEMTVATVGAAVVGKWWWLNSAQINNNSLSFAVNVRVYRCQILHITNQGFLFSLFFNFAKHE